VGQWDEDKSSTHTNRSTCECDEENADGECGLVNHFGSSSVSIRSYRVVLLWLKGESIFFSS